MCIKALPVVLGLLVASGVALADSDGYFCTGRGYLAHQWNGLSVPTPGHVLTVTFVGGPEGLAPPLSLELPSFQVHGMKCNHDSVELRGYDAVHVVGLSRESGLTLRQEVPVEWSVKLAGFEGRNLADYAVPGVVPIESDDPDHVHVLVTTREEQHAPGLVRHHTRTELVRLDAAGGVLERREIYGGVFEETVD